MSARVVFVLAVAVLAVVVAVAASVTVAELLSQVSDTFAEVMPMR